MPGKLRGEAMAAGKAWGSGLCPGWDAWGCMCVEGPFPKEKQEVLFYWSRGPRRGTCPHLTQGLRSQAWRPEQRAVSSWCPLLLAERRVTEEVC